MYDLIILLLFLYTRQYKLMRIYFYLVLLLDFLTREESPKLFPYLIEYYLNDINYLQKRIIINSLGFF